MESLPISFDPAGPSVPPNSVDNPLTVNGSSSKTLRASAKEKVVASWAQHRKEHSSQAKSKKEPDKSDDSRDFLPVCRILKHAWEQATLDLGRKFKASSSNNKASSSRSVTNQNNNNQVFPSVLPILHASAVADQVETLQIEGNLIMDILPAGYDFDQAIQNASRNRQRAFLLLDLAAMVKAHVTWQRQCGGSHVKLQYAVQHNRDDKLLELWGRLGVGLRTGSSHDVQFALPALLQQSSPQGAGSSCLLVDDMRTTRKPDGYIRRFSKACREFQERPCFSVDGPEEVVRIHQTMERLERRRAKMEPSTAPHSSEVSVDFILRLERRHEESWISLVQSTQSAARERSHRLVGISLDVFPKSETLDPTEDESDALPREKTLLDSLQLALKELCTVLACELRDGKSDSVRVDITGIMASPSTVVTTWLSELGKLYNVTVDASEMLMSNVGALCTRIIGVKEDGDTMHYYIDDGCYGSLYSHSSASSFTPLPLFPLEEQKHAVVNSNVWGPTCDGLDRVCRNIPLPRMHVDEWVVFPNMGCTGGMGTAFNGFDPPDTAYCVLGYFRSNKNK